MGALPVESQTGTIRPVSVQIAVRLPEELVAYIDKAVAAGRVKSRAELVARLVGPGDSWSAGCRR